MKRFLLLGMALLGFFMAFGCSSDSEGPGVEPPPPTGGGDPDPVPIPVVRDSTNAIYRQFFFSGTHNSYSGNLGGMKREGIATQLERGLRFFEFDLFSFRTQEKLNTQWTEPFDALEVFEYNGKPHFFSYSKLDAHMRILEVDGGNLQPVFERRDGMDEGERNISILSHQNGPYILSYGPMNGDLIIYGFDGTGLTTVHSGNLGNANVKLSSFIFDGSSYIAIHSRDDSTFQIRKISTDGDSLVLEAPVFEQGSIPSQEEIYPVGQDNALYLFKHNVNTVTNFKFESLDTTGDTWSSNGSQTGTSDLLFGRVLVLQSNGKIFINSYAANGKVVGSQLVVDKGQPNLVHEYDNEIDMLSGAKASVYPSEGGYYLLLQKGAAVQLSSVSIGELVLGHDAPGDEVDLSVDNPTSILLADWISLMADWSKENPDHEPLFIMTELKEYEQWLADSKWQDIIHLMNNKFGENLRFHNSSGFQNEALVRQKDIVDGKTLYFMDENGSKAGGLLGKVVLYIQPNIAITKSEETNDFHPFGTTDGALQENFLQLKRYRENNKLVSPDWRNPANYGNDIGAFIDARDNSYISRIFHMQSALGDGQYDNIRCTDVMFAVSDRPYEGLYADYVNQQKIKNELENVLGCD